MKKVVTLFALMAGVGLAFGQAVVHDGGVVSFNNNESGKSGVVSHLVTNGVTGQLVIGTQYNAELFLVTGGTKGGIDGSLTPIAGAIAPFRGATSSAPGTWSGFNVTFPLYPVAGYFGGVDVNNDGTGEAGVDYIDPVTGTTIPGADGTGHYPIMLRVLTWDATGGLDYTASSVKGQSKNFIYTQIGNAPLGVNDQAMITQPSFTMVPEPSAIALSVLGVAGLLLIRRRK